MVIFKAKFEVPYHAVLKNNKQISYNKKTGKRFLRSNDRVVFAQNWILNKLFNEKLKSRVDKINCYFNLKLIFYFPESVFYTKKGIRSLKIPDISNLYELPQDLLTKSGIIEDDTLVDSHNGSKRLPIEGSKYYLEIEIESVQA